MIGTGASGQLPVMDEGRIVGIVDEVETLGYVYNDPQRGTYGPGS